MTTCPKCGHERQPDEAGPDYACPQCGVVYAKYGQPVPPRPVPKRAALVSRIMLALLAAALAFSGYAIYVHIAEQQQRKAVAVAAARAAEQAAALAAKQKADAERAAARAAKQRADAERVEREAARARAQREQDAREADAARRVEAMRAVFAMMQVYQRWEETARVASATPRIGLAIPVLTMQSLQREVEAIAVPACLERARRLLVDGMRKGADAFIDFMRNPNGAGETLAAHHFQAARKSLDAYPAAVRDCN